MNKTGKKLLIASFLILLLTFGIVFALRLKEEAGKDEPADVPVYVIDDETGTEEKYDREALKKVWDENRAISSDYIGQILFPSGLLDLPFVQGPTNETYLRKDWKSGEYTEEGSVFLDYLNDLDDRNLILYGHFVYSNLDPERTHMFTPLEKLLKQENYDANKTVLLLLEDEIREYEVAMVYYCELEADESGEYVYTRDDMQYYWVDDGERFFDYENRTINANYFREYIDAARENAQYDTGVSFDFSDRFLTLQTCVENHDELREIVLCKEVSRIPYTN